MMTRFQHFTEHMLNLCLEHEASVTSWIRTRRRNQLVGGHPDSQHLSGTAVDLVLDKPENAQKLITAARNLNYTAIHEGDHIHIQTTRTKK